MAQNIKRTTQAIISVAIVIVVAIITVFIFRALSHSEDAAPSLDSGSASHSSSAKDTSSTSGKGSDEDIVTRESEKNYYDTEDANSSENITGVLSYAGLQGGELVVNVTIDQYLSSGTCSLVFDSATDSVDISSAVNSSTCSFRLPADDFAPGATYSYIINIFSGDRAGAISGEVDL